LFDNLKDAESGTYSFIAEMEEGGHVSGSDALAQNPGGGTVHSSQKTGAAAVTAGVKNMTVSGAAGAAKPAAAAASSALKVGDKILALWEDGKHYPAEIKKIEAGGKVTVLYTEYGNTKVVTAKDLKRVPATTATALHPHLHLPQKLL